MTQQTGIKQIVITAVALLLVQAAVGIFSSLKATSRDHYTIQQNSKDIDKLNVQVERKADAERIGEIMSLMKQYHDISIKAIETNDAKYKTELDRINQRIDNLLQKYNTLRGSQ